MHRHVPTATRSTPCSRTLPVSCAVALWLCAAACGGGDEEPEVPPHVAGSYTLALQQLDSGCLPPDFDFWEVFAFAENNGNNLPVITAEIEQDEGALVATLGPSGCVLTGGIVAGGAFSLNGDCDDALMARELRFTGTISPYGSNWNLDAILVIDVDLPGSGADGEVDCTVDPVEVSGTGSPAA